MKKYFYIFLFLSVPLVSLAGGPTLPSEWRLPTDKELESIWREGEYKNTIAIGDFNGDGLVEGAFLAVSKDGNYEGLLAFIYVNNKEKWFVLSKSKFQGTVFMGLDAYKPGKYNVLCTNETECKKGYKKEITLKNDAFNHYRFASSSSIYVWNKKSKGFNQIWESD